MITDDQFEAEAEAVRRELLGTYADGEGETFPRLPLDSLTQAARRLTTRPADLSEYKSKLAVASFLLDKKATDGQLRGKLTAELARLDSRQIELDLLLEDLKPQNIGEVGDQRSSCPH